MSALLEVNDLCAYYVTSAYGIERTVQAVERVSLTVRENEVFGIAGESGCGKSTLLKILLGMASPPLRIVGGSVTYHVNGGSLDIFALPEAKRRQLRWQVVSYIPQGSMHALNPVRRIRDTFHDFIRAHRRLSKRQIDEFVGDYLGNLGLPSKVLDSYPHQLSGGMRQRITIALATILSPPLVLADEPTTALDVVVQRGVLQFLEEVRQRQESTLVLVTHDMGVHANLADRVAVLYAGQVVEEANTTTLFAQPVHPYTQYLIRSLPKLDDRTERLSIPGRPPALDNPPTGCRFHPRCPYAMAICKTTAPPLEQVGPNHRAACYLLSARGGDGSHA
ncbi:MAG TPA: ABC transporter ATP-binding protein [Chloroflexota bacterium]|jgi:peptide/nickel transport system ATP-binding protein|nr:ABC transporter ATP-binding protein [Chloroflexota bacterium]